MQDSNRNQIGETPVIASKFTLCESTLVGQTRDVYGRKLPAGKWQYIITLDNTAKIINENFFEVKTLDRSLTKWSKLPIRNYSNSDNETVGDFVTAGESELKFNFSSTTSTANIKYHCEILPV